MLLGHPCTAGCGASIHAGEVVQIFAADFFACVIPEHVGNCSGERDRAVEADVSLGEQESHGEAEQMGRCLTVRQPDCAATIYLLVLRFVPGINHHPICDAAVAIIGHQRRRGVAVGVVRLCVNIREHPLAEIGELLEVRAQARFAGDQERLKIGIETIMLVHWCSCVLIFRTHESAGRFESTPA